MTGATRRETTLPLAPLSPKGEITTVIFDVGGVLADDLLKPLRLVLADEFSEDFGLTEAVLKEASREVTRLHADLGYEFDSGYHRRLVKEGLQATPRGGELSDAELERTIESQVSWGTWEETIRATIGKHSLCNEPVIRLARELQKAGLTVAVLSDDSIEMARARMNECGYLELMGRDRIFISSDFNTKKPGARIYEIVAEKLGLAKTPERAVFIDNKHYNIRGYAGQPPHATGSTGVGLWGIFFEGQRPSPEGYVPGESVENLRQCLRVIGIGNE